MPRTLAAVSVSGTSAPDLLDTDHVAADRVGGVPEAEPVGGDLRLRRVVSEDLQLDGASRCGQRRVDLPIAADPAVSE